MDTSKEYIKMCEKAVEIQTHPIKCKNSFGISLIEETIGEEVFGEINNTRGYYELWGYYIDDVQFVGKIPNECIWLPRQDQLQEMVYTHPERLFRFYEFLQHHYIYNCETWGSLGNYSMEQLWLAFVMKEKYGKIWNGEDWIAEKERYDT